MKNNPKQIPTKTNIVRKIKEPSIKNNKEKDNSNQSVNQSSNYYNNMEKEFMNNQYINNPYASNANYDSQEYINFQKQQYYNIPVDSYAPYINTNSSQSVQLPMINNNKQSQSPLRQSVQNTQINNPLSQTVLILQNEQQKLQRELIDLETENIKLENELLKKDKLIEDIVKSNTPENLKKQDSKYSKSHSAAKYSKTSIKKPEIAQKIKVDSIDENSTIFIHLKHQFQQLQIELLQKDSIIKDLKKNVIEKSIFLLEIEKYKQLIDDERKYSREKEIEFIEENKILREKLNLIEYSRDQSNFEISSFQFDFIQISKNFNEHFKTEQFEIINEVSEAQDYVNSKRIKSKTQSDANQLINLSDVYDIDLNNYNYDDIENLLSIIFSLCGMKSGEIIDFLFSDYNSKSLESLFNSNEFKIILAERLCKIMKM